MWMKQTTRKALSVAKFGNTSWWGGVGDSSYWGHLRWWNLCGKQDNKFKYMHALGFTYALEKLLVLFTRLDNIRAIVIQPSIGQSITIHYTTENWMD